MNLKKVIALIIIFLVTKICFTQENSLEWKLFPKKKTDTSLIETLVKKVDTVYSITKSGKKGTIEVNVDDRVNGINEILSRPEDGVSVKISGYRLQLASSKNKDVVNQERAKFIITGQKVPTYIKYTQPNYRLRAGNFRTKLEAHKLHHDIMEQFPNAIVISDMIELPKLDFSTPSDE